MEHLNYSISCPFCGTMSDRQKLAESHLAFAIFDKFPVNAGHALIIPKRHVADYFELSSDEKAACWQLLDEVKRLLDADFQPQGFNIGINVGENAGQTVMHVHLHLIPRYDGDVENPRGGVRGVIPGRKEY